MGNEDIELVKTVKPEKKRSLREKYDIALEKLSYEYITESHNAKEIEKMVLILRSGEEGYFPDLLKHSEDRLRVLNPESRVFRVPQPILTPKMLKKEQQEELANDMTHWMHQMHLREKDLEDGKSLDLNDTFPQPEVRKIPTKTSKSTPKNQKSGRITSCDYASWDKYDADTEVNRIDLKAEQELVKVKQSQQKMKERKLAEKEAINKLALTGTEITVLAAKEREKGNEAFRAGDYDEALQQYSLSLAIDSTINGYNNRAITFIKLKKFEEAIQDCNRVLSMDYTNVKAMLRRATALENSGRKEEALRDYSAALKIEPNNKTAILGVKKLSVYEECKKVRMTIEELDENDEPIEKESIKKSVKPSPAAESKVKETKSSKLMIEEIKPSSEDKRSKSKPSKREVKEVKFAEDSKTERRYNEICFCDRAPGSSSFTKPLPHRRGEYCLGVGRNEVKKSQSIFTYSDSWSDYCRKASGVVIEEIPSEPCDHIPKKKATKKGTVKRKVENREEVIKDTSDVCILNADSPYEFLCTWQSLKSHSDLKLHAKLLRTLGFSNLETIIGSKLDGNMLSTILQCLERHFCQKEDSEFVKNFLEALTGLRRFSIISMFMDSRDVQAVKTIIDFLEQQSIHDTSSLRKHYNITS